MVNSPLRFVRTFSIALAGVLLATQLASAQPFRLIVTHLEPPLVPNAVMDLAVELGYFEAEGVEVELIRVQQTPSAIAALRAGEGEMANIGVDALLLLHARGDADLVAVGSPNKSLPFLIAARDDIASPADLSGQAFGVGRIGSLDHSLSAKVLESEGVDMDTLEILTLGQPAVRAQALAAGQVDATTMSIGVWMSIPDKEGLAILIDQNDYYAAAPVVNKVNVVPRSVLEERRDGVEAVTRALIKISRDFSENSDAWATAIAPYGGNLSEDDLRTLGRSFEGNWSVNGGMSRSELQFTQDWIFDTEDFQGLDPVAFEQWIDFSVVDTVLADLEVDSESDPADR
jgi:NitT/TauT family transport system substrate-binding protein